MTKLSPVPRVIFCRHGETEWSLTGQHTSVTDLPLTENGVKRIEATAKALVGPDRLIAESRLEKVFVSPRRRAQQTLEIYLNQLEKDCAAKIPVEITEDIREWDYGDYEGLKTAQIKELRASRGLGSDWSIWSDGCEGGEMPQQVSDRIDRLIDKINLMQTKALAENRPSDIMVVAHGHILRCFVLRWVKRPIEVNPSFILEAGGVGVLSYEHRNCQEPAIHLGGAFIVPGE